MFKYSLIFRGLCDRTGFDTTFMIKNDETSGFITFIGEKHTIIQFDMPLFRWNMTVVNNPNISGYSDSDAFSLLLGIF